MPKEPKKDKPDPPKQEQEPVKEEIIFVGWPEFWDATYINHLVTKPQKAEADWVVPYLTLEGLQVKQYGTHLTAKQAMSKFQEEGASVVDQKSGINQNRVFWGFVRFYLLTRDK